MGLRELGSRYAERPGHLSTDPQEARRSSIVASQAYARKEGRTQCLGIPVTEASNQTAWVAESNLQGSFTIDVLWGVEWM